MPNPYRSWNIRDNMDRPGGVARDELGRVKHPVKTEWYLVRTADKDAKTCVVTSFDAFIAAFPGASAETQRDIKQAFCRFPNLSLTCFVAPLR